MQVRILSQVLLADSLSNLLLKATLITDQVDAVKHLNSTSFCLNLKWWTLNVGSILNFHPSADLLWIEDLCSLSLNFKLWALHYVIEQLITVSLIHIKFSYESCLVKLSKFHCFWSWVEDRVTHSLSQYL